MYREALFRMAPEQFDHNSYLELFKTVQAPHLAKFGRVDQRIFLGPLSDAIFPFLTKVTTPEQFKELLNIHETLQKNNPAIYSGFRTESNPLAMFGIDSVILNSKVSLDI